MVVVKAYIAVMLWLATTTLLGWHLCDRTGCCTSMQVYCSDMYALSLMFVAATSVMCGSLIPYAMLTWTCQMTALVHHA